MLVVLARGMSASPTASSRSAVVMLVLVLALVPVSILSQFPAEVATRVTTSGLANDMLKETINRIMNY